MKSASWVVSGSSGERDDAQSIADVAHGQTVRSDAQILLLKLNSVLHTLRVRVTLQSDLQTHRIQPPFSARTSSRGSQRTSPLGTCGEVRGQTTSDALRCLFRVKSKYRPAVESPRGSCAVPELFSGTGANCSQKATRKKPCERGGDPHHVGDSCGGRRVRWIPPSLKLAQLLKKAATGLPKKHAGISDGVHTRLLDTPEASFCSGGAARELVRGSARVSLQTDAAQSSSLSFSAQGRLRFSGTFWKDRCGDEFLSHGPLSSHISSEQMA
ncbi:hypothetical protein E1301_Tti021430 [Triplophysa tibetana]|uniref:Uncharacterized protein n=1 Tax=Triplophysa tibetana TaxID=1572043 RepID=A0A5A9PUS2_9TELE|nr:hypothetical protein E1301_Tti021430 [Triplophysa tibetana]